MGQNRLRGHRRLRRRRPGRTGYGRHRRSANLGRKLVAGEIISNSESHKKQSGQQTPSNGYAIILATVTRSRLIIQTARYGEIFKPERTGIHQKKGPLTFMSRPLRSNHLRSLQNGLTNGQFKGAFVAIIAANTNIDRFRRDPFRK